MTAIAQWAEEGDLKSIPERLPVLYALQLSNGLVKVGRTERPRQRARQHLYGSHAMFGGHARSFWWTECRDPKWAERLLLARMKRVATQHRRSPELFSHTTVAVAFQLCEHASFEVDLLLFQAQERDASDSLHAVGLLTGSEL